MDPLIQEFSIMAGTKLAEAWHLPEPVQEAIRFYPDEAYHHATSPTKGAMITCLADHLATAIVDPSSLDEEVMRAHPVVQDLNFYPEDMDALFELKDTIQQSVETFLA
jgi:HD-like signal output (HDOD) protein